jgi:hypothetical protein
MDWFEGEDIRSSMVWRGVRDYWEKRKKPAFN